MPGNNILGKLAPVDDLDVLHEDRPLNVNSGTMDSLEARLRSEIFETERANDKVSSPHC